MKFTILPLYNGDFTLTAKGKPDDEKTPVFAFLLVDENRRPILVDAGFSPLYIPGGKTAYDQNAAQSLPALLHDAGFSPADIQTVILTHLHWDHTAGLSLFPHARFLVQANEFRALSSLHANEEIYYCPQDWLNLLPQFDLVDGDVEVCPGIRLLVNGLHCYGHQSVEVETSIGKVILAGDLPFDYSPLWTDIPDSVWERFRSGPGARYYWTPEILPRIEAWRGEKGCGDSLFPMTKRDLGVLASMSARLVLSHDRRLIGVRSIP